MSFKNDDDEIWRNFLQGVQPLKHQKSKVLFYKKSRFFSKQMINSQHYSHLLLPSFPTSDLPSVNLERKSKKVMIEARLDLHGETLKSAYFLLTEFLEKSFRLHHHVVLIITGKSFKKKVESTHTYRLVEIVPYWLKTEPLKKYVKKISQARPNEGGAGAFYVFLS